MKKWLAVGILLWMAVAFVLQLAVGNCHVSFMAFPVNVAIVAVLAGLLFVAVREWGDSVFVRLLASRQMSVATLLLVAAACMVLGLVPQDTGAVDARIISALGFDRFTSSLVFYFVMLLLMVHLMVVTMRYNKSRRMVWRFRINHIGLLVTLAALCFGAADTHRFRAVVPIGGTVERAFDSEGVSHRLGYTFTLTGFDMEYYGNGTPSRFSADAMVNGSHANITVNHPWRATWKDDVYLVGYDVKAGKDSVYCIMEFVCQPWKYAVVLGMVMMAAGAVLMFWGGRAGKEVAV